MTSSPTVVLLGTVRHGAIVSDQALQLPDGTHAGICIRLYVPDPNLAAELAQWDAAGDEAWAMIEEWERAEVR